MALSIARAKRVQRCSASSDARVDTGVPNAARFAAALARLFPPHDDLLRVGDSFRQANRYHSRSEFCNQGDRLAFSGQSQSSEDHENPEVLDRPWTGSGGESILRLSV